MHTTVIDTTEICIFMIVFMTLTFIQSLKKLMKGGRECILHFVGTEVLSLSERESKG